MSPTVRGRAALALLVLAVVAAGSTPVAGTAVPGDARATEGLLAGRGSDAGAGDLATAAARAPTNDTPVPRHRNPDRAAASGDLAATSDWLAARLAARLGEGAVRIERGEYEAARRLVGEAFDGRLAGLVDVAGGTDAPGDDRVAERLARTRDRQRRFATAVADYRETRRSYRAARRAGNDTRARALARDLERAAGTVNRTGRALVADYASLSNETGADLSAAATSVAAVRRNVTGQQATVRAETFVATRLVAGAPDRPVSFADPLPVTGRLLAGNGTPVANRSVRLEVGDRTLRTRTSATGGFRVRYRPVGLAANATVVAVRFSPRNRSAYLGSATAVPVSVRAVRPDVSVTARPSRVRFGDRLSVTGTVAVDGVGVPGVPVVVRVGAVRLGRVPTAGNGSFALRARLPAGIAAGEARVGAAVADAGRAVVAANGSSSVTVARTASNLTVTARRAGEGSLDVAGRLTAANRPVAGRSVVLRLNGSHVRTVATGEDGRYAATVPAGRVPDAGPVVVAAVHAAAGSNLRDATARVTVEPSAGRPGPDRSPLGRVVAVVVANRAVVVAGGLAAGLLVAVVVLRRRRRRLSGEPADAPREPSALERADAGTDPLAAARARLDADDPEGAVRVAYAAVRVRLADGPGTSSRTHREFRADVGDEVGEDGVAALDRLTEAYERAAFAPTPVDGATAADALDAAADLLD